jgi:hypothetical protein
LNHSPAYVLAQHLISEGYGVAPGDSGEWPLFVANLPDGDKAEDDALALVDTSGVKDGRLMSGTPLFHHGIQLRVRARAYNTGYNKAQTIASYLATIQNVEEEVDSITYTLNNVTQTTDVVSIGQGEARRREEFSVNFLVTLKEE